jgi:hypothetical protein
LNCSKSKKHQFGNHLGSTTVVDAPPEQRARVAAQKTGGFAGGMAGASLGAAGGTAAAGGIAALLKLSGPPGWLVLALGVVGAGALGYAGSEADEAGGGALHDAARSEAGGGEQSTWSSLAGAPPGR